jgi:hypothetical protein
MYKFSIYLLFIFITMFTFVSCDESSGGGGVSVQVYSQAPVLRAVVKDARGQIAVQKDLSKNIYYFNNPPLFPLVATSNAQDSFIDIDFDGNRTASDTVFDDILYSTTSLISLSTTVLLESADINTSSYEYNVTKYKDALSQYSHAFSISSNDLLYKSAIESSQINLAVLTDTLYDVRQNTDFNASDLASLDKKYNVTQNFYYEHLSTLEVAEAAKYSAFYNALNLLDKKKIIRAQQNTRASVPNVVNRDYLQNIENLPDSSLLSSEYNQDSNLAYWAMKIDSVKNIAYMAAGNDGMDTVDITYAKPRLQNQEQNSSGFGTSVDFFDREDARCIFLSDQENQVVIYGLWPLDHANDANASSLIGTYRNTTIAGAKTFDIDFTNTNANNLELLLVSNSKAGLEIFDIKDLTCKETIELNSTRKINTTAIGSDTYSSVVSSNQKIVYVADGVNGIISVDISGSQPQILNTTVLKNGETAYSLHMVPNSNELYVSTDNGIQIYNSDNTGLIEYRGLYATEGSRSNTLGETLRVSLSKNHRALFVADITAGLKILDITDSTNPKLCGVAYFSAANIIERTSVRDVTLVERDNGVKQVYIANDSNGLIVIDDASHLLFEHCKNLLD